MACSNDRAANHNQWVTFWTRPVSVSGTNRRRRGGEVCVVVVVSFEPSLDSRVVVEACTVIWEVVLERNGPCGRLALLIVDVGSAGNDQEHLGLRGGRHRPRRGGTRKELGGGGGLSPSSEDETRSPLLVVIIPIHCCPLQERLSPAIESTTRSANQSIHDGNSISFTLLFCTTLLFGFLWMMDRTLFPCH